MLEGLRLYMQAFEKELCRPGRLDGFRPEGTQENVLYALLLTCEHQNAQLSQMHGAGNGTGIIARNSRCHLKAPMCGALSRRCGQYSAFTGQPEVVSLLWFHGGAARRCF